MGRVVKEGCIGMEWCKVGICKLRLGMACWLKDG